MRAGSCLSPFYDEDENPVTFGRLPVALPGRRKKFNFELETQRRPIPGRLLYASVVARRLGQHGLLQRRRSQRWRVRPGLGGIRHPGSGRLPVGFDPGNAARSDELYIVLDLVLSIRAALSRSGSGHPDDRRNRPIYLSLRGWAGRKPVHFFYSFLEGLLFPARMTKGNGDSTPTSLISDPQFS